MLPSEVLQAEHRRIDEAIRAVADGGGSASSLSQALQALVRHIFIEETLLFPPLQAAGLTLPVAVMNREHGEMWPLVQALTAACDAAQIDALARHDARDLYLRLRVHNPKEEEVLYAAADRHAAACGHTAFCQALDAARTPAGWACQASGLCLPA